MKDRIKKLCENYALRIYELEDVVPNLAELGDAVGSAEAEGEILCLMNVVKELGNLLEDVPKEFENKEIAFDLLYELVCNESIDYDVNFIGNDGKRYIFDYNAFDYFIKEYRRDNVLDGMSDMKHMVDNGIYQRAEE